MELIGKEINNCFKVIKKIEDDSICNVYKMKGLYTPLEVVIKIFKKNINFYNKEDLLRFKQKGMSIYNINHPNIVKLYEIDEINNYPYIIMEYINGLSIKKYLKNKKNLNFNEILKIIISICKGLEAAHRKGAIHENLNLNNIILPYNKNYNEVKITNFGFSDLIMTYQKNDQVFINDILSFLPPEFYNIYNKKIDERSDLYSLGVILYYLLTDKNPVESNCIDGYFRNCIYKNIKRPSKNSYLKFPVIIDKIILKLLNFEKKDRYQSALNLLNDLEKLQRNNTDFELGVDDLNFDTNFETDLINRKDEFNILKNQFEEVLIKSKGKIYLINGKAGAGKTRLIDEFKKYIFKNNGIFIESSCNSIEIKKPFSVIYDLIYNFFNYIDRIDKKIQAGILKKISNTFKNQHDVLLKYFKFLSKELKIVKKEKNNISRDEYLDILLNFFITIIDNEFPVVLIIKNIQWLDYDSLFFLKKIKNKIINYPVFIIYVFNNDYKGNQFINQDIQKININKMNKPVIKEIISNIMGINFKIPDKLINYIYSKSEGIPYYAIEILRILINYEVIFTVINTWQVDLSKLIKIKLNSKNDILLNKIQLLKNYELNILLYASIFEIDFSIDQLFNICQNNKNDIITAVDYLEKQGILKLIYKKNRNKYYVNENIKNILIKKLNKNQKIIIHEEIARALEEMFSQNNDKEYLFLIAYHYKNSKNYNKAIEYNIKSGLYFKEIFGFKEAIKCFKNTLKMIEKNEEKNNDKLNDVKKYINQITNKT